MKTIKILLLLTIGLFSCDKEDVQPKEEEEQLDCNCDRVVSVQSFNLPTTTFWNYVTINDCTQVQKSGTKYTEVKLNDCI